MALTRLTVIYIVQLLVLYYCNCVCSVCNDGEYVPDPYDCSRFRQCHFGEWYQHSCPGGLHFNPVLLVCDFPWNANCVIDSSTTTTTPTKETTPPPEEPPTLPSTTSLPTTTSPPMPTSLPTTTTTPDEGDPDFSWQPTLQPTQPSLTTTLPTIPPFFNCPQDDRQSNVVHLPHPNCTMFYKCVHGIPHEMLCPFSQHWAMFLDRCDSPAEANCIDGAASEQTDARPPNYW